MRLPNTHAALNTFRFRCQLNAQNDVHPIFVGAAFQQGVQHDEVEIVHVVLFRHSQRSLVEAARSPTSAV